MDQLLDLGSQAILSYLVFMIIIIYVMISASAAGRGKDERRIDGRGVQESDRDLGEEAQIDQVIEEMGEVLVAYNHNKRKRVSKDALIEEFVDVYIMMKQMRFLNESVFDMIYEYKVNRLKHRLEIKEKDDAIHRTEG